MTTAAFQAYARRIRDLLRANPATPETGLAPAFQNLLIELIPALPAVPELTVVPEFNKPGVGRPDIALKRPGEPARAFVELKAPAVNADPDRWRGTHNERQRERLRELASWSTCNFLEFRLFRRSELIGSAEVVPADALRPDIDDRTADRLVAEHGRERFTELLTMLCRTSAPEARDAQELAANLAHSARIVRSAVQERIGELGPGNGQHPLVMVRNTFRNVLYAHPEAGGYVANDFDELFSSAFAQTLAFGLLLVREDLTGRGDLPPEQRLVGADAWLHMPEEHPLMRAALRVLSQEEVARDFGIGFEVMRDTVNCFAPEILAIQRDGRDPILYFYEDFLQIFDPAARERYGVYYTPLKVVRFMAGALDRALRENLGTNGLADPAVTVLDPATGTGTFLLGVAERVRNEVLARGGAAEAAMALADLSGRMFGLELLVGPYAVAHYRLHHALRAVPPEHDGERPEPVPLHRLGVYLADTLSNPLAEPAMGELGMHGIPIAEERREAQRVKAQQPILAIIGNPPYRRLEAGEDETLVGRWMNDLWDDLKAPVRAAGKGNQLNTFPELSVAFWRWALWKLFEAENAPRRGVVAFIANRKFLTGWPYAGLRRMMRERFDRIEIIDLRGDVRAGVRGDVARDQGVFNIQVGTAITLAIADGSKAEGARASVTYLDSWAAERFSKQAKLDWLEDHREAGAIAGGVVVDRDWLDDFRPAPFSNGEWVSLLGVFAFSSNGVQTKRDAFVYSVSSETLSQRIEAFCNPNAARPDVPFHSTEAKSEEGAMQAGFLADRIIAASYRPLDHRSLYNDISFIDRRRPTLQAAWGKQNVGFYAMPSGTGSGPAVWCHGLLPDYHSFSGRGGYAFPLHDRRAGPEAHNLAPGLLVALALAYGRAVTPAEAFDAVLALLSASSYTTRFAEDLEDTFPHVPFPADHAVFLRAAAVGAQIRAVETFARDPAAEALPPGFCRLANQPTGPLDPQDYADGALPLCADGSARLTGLPEAVWAFSVSGYRVLPRWLEARRGQPLDIAMIRQVRDVAGRIA